MTYFLDRIEALPNGVRGYIGDHGFPLFEGEARADLGQVALRLRLDWSHPTPLELEEALNQVCEGVLRDARSPANYRARVLELPPELRGEAALGCAWSLWEVLEVKEGLEPERMVHDISWTLLVVCPERTLDFVASVGYDRAHEAFETCALQRLKWASTTPGDEGSRAGDGCEQDLEFCEVWHEPHAPSVGVGLTFGWQSGLL